MTITGWKTRYREIRNEFGYNEYDDLRSAKKLNRQIDKKYPISNIKKIISGKIIFIIRAGPSLTRSISTIKKYKNVTKIVADGAVQALIEHNIKPDILVTDLDGDMPSIKKIGRSKIPIIVHAHGNNYEKLELAKVAISRILNDFTSSVLGNNYVISATLNHAVDNGAVSELIVEGLSPEKYTLEFISPGNFISYNYREHTIVAIVVTLIILLLLFLTYYISVKKINERNLRKIHQADSEKEFQTKISKQNDNIESLLNEQKDQKHKEEKAKADSLLVEQEKKLIALMKNSGGFPILKCTEFKDDNFIVNKPVVTVGRDQSNLLCIPNQNVSSKHFEIRFDKGSYKIFDKNSLNGVLVNGRKIKDCVLNNGDIITIADVAITFYL